MRFFARYARSLAGALRLYTEHRAHHWTATITLFAFVMIFPVALFTTAVVQTVDAQKLEAFFELWMPVEAVRVLVTILSRARSPEPLEIALSLLVSVWGLSHILHSIIEISDEFYQFHERRFWHRRALALVMLIGLLFYQWLTLTLYTVLSWFRRIAEARNILPWHNYQVMLVHWAGNLVLLLLHLLSLVLLYGVIAPGRFRWRGALPGAAFAALGGWMASRLLVLYVNRMPIEDIYGALTNFVVFLVWVYWQATLFIVGIGVNRSWSLLVASEAGSMV